MKFIFLALIQASLDRQFPCTAIFVGTASLEWIEMAGGCEILAKMEKISKNSSLYSSCSEIVAFDWPIY